MSFYVAHFYTDTTDFPILDLIKNSSQLAVFVVLSVQHAMIVMVLKNVDSTNESVSRDPKCVIMLCFRKTWTLIELYGIFFINN